ncbi:hypothetical protein PSHT_05923 [Puccinia striiformis]|uniref:Ribosomal RNA-processing protein 42 n=1 Tax=Puccinia striiformis TaxID=27350 RepID=A0A2S4W959_9BASI|nr:hypothetical protein PSHT_05923 [Puccinia striiformis]
MIYGPLGSSKQLRISSTHAWVIYIDAVVISASAGNAMDVICMAVHKALCNLKLPKTAEVGYQRTKATDTAVPIEVETLSSVPNDSMVAETGIQGLLWHNRPSKTKSSSQAYDFELKDTDAEHGDRLSIKDFIPIVITINLIDQKMFLDATLEEESISSNRLILAYTEVGKKLANVIQTGGKSEIGFDLLRSVIREGAKVAGDLSKQLDQPTYLLLMRSRRKADIPSKTSPLLPTNDKSDTFPEINLDEGRGMSPLTVLIGGLDYATCTWSLDLVVGPLWLLSSVLALNCKPQYGAGFVSDLNLSDAMCVLAGARSNKIWLVRNTGSDKGPTGTQIADNGGFHHSFQKSFSVPAAVPEEVVEVSAETKAAEDSGGYVQAGGCPAAIGCNGHLKTVCIWANLQAISGDQVNTDDPNSEYPLTLASSCLIPTIVS